MSNPIVQRMQPQFDALANKVPDEAAALWYARDLQESLGYVRSENFLAAIQRALGAVKSTGYDAADHFRGVTKMIGIGKLPTPDQH